MQKDTEQTENYETNGNNRLFRLFRNFPFVPCLSRFVNSRGSKPASSILARDEPGADLLGDCIRARRIKICKNDDCIDTRHIHAERGVDPRSSTAYSPAAALRWLTSS